MYFFLCFNLFIMKCPSLSLIILFVLESTLFNKNTAVPLIFSHHFTLTFLGSSYLKCASHKQHTLKKCFSMQYVTDFIGVFGPFIFYIINCMVREKSTMWVFAFCLIYLFLCFSFIAVFWMKKSFC